MPKPLTENINHWASIRMRVMGQGDLHITCNTLDDVLSKELVPIAMEPVNRKEPLRIANFVSQRASFTFKTTDFDDQMRVNRIVFFVKPLFTNYPS